MAFSYSFHLSSKSHSVSTINKIGQVSKHNLREYESKDYDRNQIEILRGSDVSILDSVKQIYHEEFDDALKKYNEGKRADRKIGDYLTHISDSRGDVACEFIIQIGDKDFWRDFGMQEKKQMSYIFKDQIRALEKLVPELKIASAVIHYDESSPHMHIVGVPVATGYQKGMEKQVAKTKVFTAERLRYLQDRMRENAEKGMRLPENANLFAGVELKEKEKGRNKDIPKKYLEEFYEKEREAKQSLEIAEYEVKQKIEQATEKYSEIAEEQKAAYDVIVKGASNHEKPVISVVEQEVKDGLFNKHSEWHVGAVCADEKTAKIRQKELESLYTKDFTEKTLKEAVNDKIEAFHNATDQEKKELKATKNKLFEMDREVRASAREISSYGLKQSKLYKELSFESLGMTPDNAKAILNSAIVKEITEKAIDTTLEELQSRHLLAPQFDTLEKAKVKHSVINKIKDNFSDFAEKVKLFIMQLLSRNTMRNNKELEYRRKRVKTARQIFMQDNDITH